MNILRLFFVLIIQITLFAETSNQLIPLSFDKAINKILNAKICNKLQNTEQDQSSLLRTAFHSIADLDSIHFPNVTHECEEQFLNFTYSLKNRELWAIAGLHFFQLFFNFNYI
jgi:hypothetical protein